MNSASIVSAELNSVHHPGVTYSERDKTAINSARTATADRNYIYQTTILDVNSDTAEIPPPPPEGKDRSESSKIWEKRDTIYDKHKKQQRKVNTMKMAPRLNEIPELCYAVRSQQMSA